MGMETPLGTAEQQAATEPEALVPEPELVKHPGPAEYIRVAVVLAIATGFEVALYYLSLPHAVFVLLLLFFAFAKFALVALWFMHLRFDARIFRRLFTLGISLAITVYFVVLLTFRVLFK